MIAKVAQLDAIQIHHGDCLDIMPTLDADSVDSIVTDAPYGLSFMGKDWDHGIPGEKFWREAMRIAKPGAHLLAFGGTRTYHRLACAIEDAGWKIRDCIMWVYGSGFPKSHNLKGDMDGWGTALKPAWEPIIVARKPLAGTVAANVQQYGTGGLNIDGCRVGTTVETWPSTRSRPSDKINCFTRKMQGDDVGVTVSAGDAPPGRWPANFIHDGSEEVVELFPVTKPAKAANRGLQHSGRHGGLADIGGNIKENTDTVRGHDGAGGSAARFFYCAKASKADRGENNHPTVKPTDLMRYLCRLVTPPDGLVLDPFMGSGSTGKAAVAEGFRFLGIELNAEYIEIAKARIAAGELFAVTEAAQ